MSELGLYKLKAAAKGAYYFGKLTIKPGIPFSMTYELAAHPLMVHLTGSSLVEPHIEEIVEKVKSAAEDVLSKIESAVDSSPKEEPKEGKKKKWSNS